MDDRPKPKRRWLRFSLRSLLLLPLVVAIPLGFLTRGLNEGRKHQRVAQQLQELGCSVRFSHKELVPVANPPPAAVVGGRLMEERSTLPSWLESLGLASAIRRIDGVTLRSPDPEKNRRALSLLKELDALGSVSFYDTGIDEKAVADLVNNVRVESLYLSREKLPRTRMAWLNNENLTWLCVARTQFSNPAIDDLPLSLTYLDATRTRVNDEGLRQFVRLENLKTLKLRRTPTTKEAVESLREQMPWCRIEWQPLLNP